MPPQDTDPAPPPPLALSTPLFGSTPPMSCTLVLHHTHFQEPVNVSRAQAGKLLRRALAQKFCSKVANYHAVYARNKTGPAAVAERAKYKSHRRQAPSEFINPAQCVAYTMYRCVYRVVRQT